MKVLIAEDEPKLLKSLVHIFESNNYSVDGVSNGIDAYDYAVTGEYDGIILDIMMPGMDGIEVLKKVRAEGITAPVLFLTAKNEVENRVEGLDAGADDYLPKPFSTRELLARVRAMLRRKEQYTPDLLSFKELTLNRSTYEISYNGISVTLSGKEYQIMEMLMERPNIILPIDEAMTHIWSWNTDADVSVVWVHISNLRKKLTKLGAPYEIRFVRGAGYVLGDKAL